MEIDVVSIRVVWLVFDGTSDDDLEDIDSVNEVDKWALVVEVVVFCVLLVFVVGYSVVGYSVVSVMIWII